MTTLQQNLRVGETVETAVQESRIDKVRNWAGQLLVAGSVGLAAASHLAAEPVQFDIGVPGINAEAVIQWADYSSLEYGARIGSDAAGSSVEILGQKFGANIQITKLDVTGGGQKTAKSTLDALVGNTSETLDSLKAKAEPAIEKSLWTAGGVGFGFAGLTYLIGKAWRKKREQDEESERARIKQIEKHTSLLEDVYAPGVSEMIEAGRSEKAEIEKRQNSQKYKLAHKLGALALGGLLVASSAGATASSLSSITPQPTTRHYIGSELSENGLAKELAGIDIDNDHIFITGDVGYLFDQLINGVGSYTNSVDLKWKNDADHLVKQITPEINKNPVVQAWRQNKNITSFANISDIHDNQAELKYFLPAALQALQPDFVINSGDQQSSSGTIFTDAGAWQRNVNALPPVGPDGKPTLEVLIPGNHDGLDSWKKATEITMKDSGGNEYHPILVPSKDNNYTVEISGLTIVGGPDLNQTTTSGTKPASHEDQMKNDAKLGATLAKTACEVAQKTGVEPILVAHEQQATYQALAESCVSLALSGHTHQDGPLTTISYSDGRTAYQKTSGSSSGDGKNNPIGIYNNPTREGEILLWFYNKAAGRPVGYVTLSISPSTPPSIKITDLNDPLNSTPNPIEQYLNISEYLSKYTQSESQTIELAHH